VPTGNPPRVALQTAAPYTEFVETVSFTPPGISEAIFQSFPAVQDLNTPSLSTFKWPTAYGTDDPPWGAKGSPFVPGSTIKRVPPGTVPRVVIDSSSLTLWTDNITAAASGRVGLLDGYKDQSLAIAGGIKAAIEGTFKAGHVTLAAGSATVTGVTFTSDSEILVSRRTMGGAPGHLSLASINPGAGSFVITSSSGTETSTVSWFIAG
jgi:hypothetical protein